jgi:hypothetical protein
MPPVGDSFEVKRDCVLGEREPISSREVTMRGRSGTIQRV